jgi:UDP-glucuronate 4-epimerase
MKILVTGAAGFIGMHTSARLLKRGDTVVGIDNLNDYYDPKLKYARLDQLKPHKGFTFEKLDLVDRDGLNAVFAREKFDRVVHLAAQAGVRYSITNPHAYAESNLTGFLNILEACRQNKIEHLVYASSSSVYGGNTKMPFLESDSVDHPVSLYAATKKANELMAHTYSHLYGLPTTGLRFFTVYGPWGRPDMAYFSFTKNIIANREIQVFNHGKMKRDFTYIDDIVDGVIATLDRPATGDPTFDTNQPNPGKSRAPYRIFNIGNHDPIELSVFITALENAIGKPAIKIAMPMQPGDVQATYANVDALSAWAGTAPKTDLQKGLAIFVNWYKSWTKQPLPHG